MLATRGWVGGRVPKVIREHFERGAFQDADFAYFAGGSLTHRAEWELPVPRGAGRCAEKPVVQHRRALGCVLRILPMEILSLARDQKFA
jgi:hypothetical protein